MGIGPSRVFDLIEYYLKTHIFNPSKLFKFSDNFPINYMEGLIDVMIENESSD
jgi:hypothetical protein